MGDKLDMDHGKTPKAGGYAVAPANVHHYAWTKTGATIQVHLNGPFAITYVNPADDPSKGGKTLRLKPTTAASLQRSHSASSTGPSLLHCTIGCEMSHSSVSFDQVLCIA